MVGGLLASRGGKLVRMFLLVAFVMALVPASALAAPGSGSPSVTYPGVISGTVYNDMNGSTIAGVEVKLYKVTGYNPTTWAPIVSLVATGATDGAGLYSFNNLPVGTDPEADTKDYVIGVSAGSKDASGEDYKAYYYDYATTLVDAMPVMLPDWDGTPSGSNTVDYADLYLTPGGPSISGTVKGSDNNLPITGAEMTLLQYDSGLGAWDLVDWDYTNPNGLYEFWSLPTGNYKVGYMGGGPDQYGVHWKPEYYNGAPTVESASVLTFTAGVAMHLTGKNITLDKAKKILTGTVYEADAGGNRLGTISWADVVLVAQSGSVTTPTVFTTTDETGVYEVYDADLPYGVTSTEVALGFSAYGYADSWWDGQDKYDSADTFAISPTQTLQTKDATLVAGIPSLEGTVTSAADGTPVEGLAVGIYDMTDPTTPYTFIFTDENGYYSWFVPSALDGTEFKIRFYTGDVEDLNFDAYGGPEAPRKFISEWFDDQADYASADPIQLDVDATQIASAQLAVVPSPAIAGKAVDASGAAVAGVWPMAWKYNTVDPDFQYWEPVAWAWEPTGADGHYDIYGLADGSYKVGHEEGMEPNGKYYLSGFYNGKPDADTADSVTVLGGVQTIPASIDVVYSELLPLFSGTVTNSKSGLPIADAQVIAWQLVTDPIGGDYWDWADMTYSDADGKYSFFSSVATTYKVSFMEDTAYVGEFYLNKPLYDTFGDINAPAATAVTTTVGVTKPGINGTLDPIARTAYRVAPNNDRYILAGSIGSMQAEAFANTPYIVLASGEDAAMADPLSAAGLSWAYHGAPLLLTKRLSTPADTMNKVTTAVSNIRRTHTGDGVTLLIAGGTASVPDARVTDIRNKVKSSLGLTTAEANAAVKVKRFGGASRYAVCSNIASEMKIQRGSEMATVGLVVNGSDPAKFWDALAASPIAASNGAPLLMVKTNTVPVPAEIRSAIATLGLTGDELVVVGPTTSVSSAVQTSLGATRRVGSGDRFKTAKNFADWAIDNGYANSETVGIAAKLADSLTGGTYCGAAGGTLLFTNTTSLPTDTKNFLTARKGTLTEILIFGGTGSITDATKTAINNALKP